MLKTQLTNQLSLTQKLSRVVGALAILAAFSVLHISQIQDSEYFHTEPSCSDCGSGYQKYTLSWEDVNWSDGSLSHTITDAASSGINFSVKYSGATTNLSSIGGSLSPSLQGYFTDGECDALSNYINPGFSDSEKIKIVINIDPPIPAHIGFDLYHVNGSSYSGDKIKIFAKSAADGSNIFPSFEAPSSDVTWELDGNGTIDAIGSAESVEDKAAGVNFESATLIDQIRIIWSNCDMCGIGQHGFAIGDITFFSPDNVLPVEWGDIQADWQEDNAQISWHTTQESNNDFFTVERSADGESFQKLAEVKSIGNRSELTSYNYIDQSAKFSSGNSLYYRIKQTDFNGAFSYSSLLELAPQLNLPLELIAFPNPAIDQISFKLAGSTQYDFDYQILNTAGKLMKSGHIQDQTEIRLEVSSWPAGNYHASFANNTQQVSKSFQIVRP